MPNAGQRVVTSGVYRSVHPRHRDADREHVLVAGETFPPCPQCADCHYELLRAAPSAQEDEDLKREADGKRNPSRPGPHGPEVLAISYDKALLDTRRMILELHGFKVTTALGWNEALHMCRRAGDFALVIIGSSIPAADKERLLNEVKQSSSVKVLSIRIPGERPLPRAEYSIESFYDAQELVKVVKEATSA